MDIGTEQPAIHVEPVPQTLPERPEQPEPSRPEREAPVREREPEKVPA